MMGKRVVGLAVLVLLCLMLGYGFGHRAEPQHEVAGRVATGAGTKQQVLYWYDPMKPDQHFDKPGKSPFMDMELVPMMAQSGVPTVVEGVRIDPALTQNLGVRQVTVEKGRLQPVVAATAVLSLNDRLVSIVQARAAGFVEKVYDRSPQDVLAKGDRLVDLRMPEWYGAQLEYLALRKSGETALVEAAYQRLYQLGMPPEEVGRLQRTLVPQAVFTLGTDRAGVLLELGVRAGMTLLPVQTLARINGLENLWLEVEVPQAQSFGMAVGDGAEIRFAGDSALYHGVVQAILPEVGKETRTVRARIEIPNPAGKWRPGMYADVRLFPTHGGAEQLLLPEEAVMTVGGKNRVILAEKEGHFLPLEVRIGGRGQGKVEVLDGLKEGDRVVVSGEFLIDSEASLKGVLMRMNGAVTP